MRQAFELYATGWYSVSTVAARLAKAGLTARNGQALSQAHLRRLLANAFYSGTIRWADLEVTGAHEPLVSEGLFAKVQQALAHRFRHSGVKGSVNGFVLKGIAICASCRGHMTAERHARWGYYRCSRQSYQRQLCDARFSNADRVHTAVRDLLKRMSLNRDAADRIRKAADSIIEDRRRRRDTTIAALEESTRRLLERELRLTEMFVANALSPSSYKAAIDQLRRDRANTDHQIEAVNIDPNRLRSGVTEILRVATSLHDLYQTMDDARQAEFLRVVLASVVLGPQGIAGFTLKEPFDALLGSRNVELSEIDATVGALLKAA